MADKNTNDEKHSTLGAKLTGSIGLFAFIITFGTLLVGAIIGTTKPAMMIWQAIFGSEKRAPKIGEFRGRTFL